MTLARRITIQIKLAQGYWDNIVSGGTLGMQLLNVPLSLTAINSTNDHIKRVFANIHLAPQKKLHPSY